MTALMLAAKHGRMHCLEALIPVSDPLAVNAQGYSALMMALDTFGLLPVVSGP
jgi:ankyrin repeat protein